MIYALFKQQIFWFLKQSFLLFWKPLFVESFQIWIRNIFISWHKIYNILPNSIQIFLHQVGNFESKQICCDRKIRQIMKGWAELWHTQNSKNKMTPKMKTVPKMKITLKMLMTLNIKTTPKMKMTWKRIKKTHTMKRATNEDNPQNFKIVGFAKKHLQLQVI